MPATHTNPMDRRPADSGAPPRAMAELRARRGRITHALLGGLAVFGAVAYVPSVWAGVRVGAWAVVVLDTVVYAAVVYAFVHRDLGLRLRAGLVVVAAAALGVTLSIMFGPNGAGGLWLAAVPVLTALLFGRRETVWSLGFVATAVLLVAVLRWAGLLAWGVTPGGGLLWVIIAANAIAIAGALALGVAALIGGLAEAAERTEEYGAALAREQEQLLEVNDQLERLIAERERAEARLRETEKLTAIGTLAGGIAHDMNNLLVPILAGTELLRAGEADPARRAELLGRTADAARAARDLVQRILAFSEPGRGGRWPLDAPTVFRDAARVLDAMLPPEIDFVFRAEPDAGTVLLANGEAHQILLNLGRNAAQAMPDGGKLAVTVDSLPAGNEPRDVATPASGRFVRLMVADSGVGMEEATLARIFEPFFTTRGGGAPGEGEAGAGALSGGGHGIGLATVYGIVSSAGGFVVPHSHPGAGTVMEVFLPQVEAEAVSGDDTAVQPAVGEGRRILVVDDSAAVRETAIRILESGGYRAVGAEDAAEALRWLQDRDRFDAVLTDLVMTGRDGLQLAATVRSLDPRMPVILMSGHIDAEVRRRADSLGIEGIVSKPFGVKQLLAAVGAGLSAGASGDHAGSH